MRSMWTAAAYAVCSVQTGVVATLARTVSLVSVKTVCVFPARTVPRMAKRSPPTAEGHFAQAVLMVLPVTTSSTVPHGNAKTVAVSPARTGSSMVQKPISTVEVPLAPAVHRDRHVELPSIVPAAYVSMAVARPQPASTALKTVQKAMRTVVRSRQSSTPWPQGQSIPVFYFPADGSSAWAATMMGNSARATVVTVRLRNSSEMLSVLSTSLMT